MTNLERLIKAHTEATTVTTLSVATERAAEELAREMLADPAVRAELRALVRTHFAATIATLRRDGRNTPHARRRPRRRR